MKLLYLQILIKNCKNIMISFFFNIISYKIFVIRKIIKKTIIKKDILYDIILSLFYFSLRSFTGIIILDL
jgi:hypothetical protein